jgi:hypothetical protein
VRALVASAGQAVQAGGEVLEASARKLALRTGHIAEALCLADTAVGDELAAERLGRFAALRLGA